MYKQSVVVIKGSRSDKAYCNNLGAYLEDNGMNVIHRTASAHRTPNLVLNILNDYKDSEDVVAIITVAGLSDALSGMVAANSTKPVIAFPPDLGKYGDAKVFSSTKLPGGVKVSLARNNEELLNLIKEKSLQAVYSPPEISGRRLKIVE
ncbi:MAG TPA: AIR carboxylase family protein, partial [archaeon]|nr:AIR carboxylase family protein [archaeon]